MKRRKLNRRSLPRWSKPLKSSEIWHLIDQKTFSLKALRKQAQSIAEIKQADPENWHFKVCLKCDHILHKLNLYFEDDHSAETN